MKKTIVRSTAVTISIAGLLALACWLTYLLSVPSFLRTARSIAPDVEKHHNFSSWNKDADGKLTKEVPEHLRLDVISIREDRGFAFYMLAHTPFDARPVLVKPLDQDRHVSEIIQVYGTQTRTHHFVVLPNGWAYWLHS